MQGLMVIRLRVSGKKGNSLPYFFGGSFILCNNVDMASAIDQLLDVTKALFSYPSLFTTNIINTYR